MVDVFNDFCFAATGSNSPPIANTNTVLYDVFHTITQHKFRHCFLVDSDNQPIGNHAYNIYTYQYSAIK